MITAHRADVKRTTNGSDESTFPFAGMGQHGVALRVRSRAEWHCPAPVSRL